MLIIDAILKRWKQHQGNQAMVNKNGGKKKSENHDSINIEG